MASVNRQKENKQDAKRQRRFTRGTVGTGRADWATVDMAQIQETIAKVSATGGAVRFGYTADGGAYAIGVYGDGPTPYTEYVRPGEDIDAFLADLGAAFDGGDRRTDGERANGKQ